MKRKSYAARLSSERQSLFIVIVNRQSCGSGFLMTLLSG